jgi:Lrp/AsnC family transcriptional regulator for asnA, asnC and gidA
MTNVVWLGSETMTKRRRRNRLDKLDRGILQALQQNARQTYKEIGTQLGVAHSTVYDRIRRLEKEGVIKQYTTMVDVEKIGMDPIMAIMTVFTAPQETETVAEKLAEATEVLEVSTSLSEELLIIAKVTAEDRDKLHAFIAEKVAPLPGVLRIRTSIVTKKYKEELFSIGQ